MRRGRNTIMSEPLVREYRDSDLDAIKRIHGESGLDYQLPDINSPLFIAKVVIEREGRPSLMVAGRIDVETYLISSGKPDQKWEDIQLAQPEYLAALWKQGIDSTFCVVPPEVNRHFGKRMRRLGWEPARNWYPWTRNTVL
jgi:hypothetical protein